MGRYVVTGANRGVGLELCRQLDARGDEVVAVCRDTSSELDDLAIRVEPGIDVADGDAIADMAQRLEGTPIDVLINNAGILQRVSFDSQRQEPVGPLDTSFSSDSW